VNALLLLVLNLALSKDPLYELSEWVASLDLRSLDLPCDVSMRFTDDRFGRALDQLYEADRASLQTRVALSALRNFGIRFDQIHNDSTSIKACGHIPGRTKTGVELRRGYSKDHRPDLKQLLFTLSLSADGAAPIHYHVYPGNRNDSTTHIDTWNDLRDLHGSAQFLYVADCKLCTQDQLAHIVAQGGQALTIVPGNLTPVREFIQRLRAGPLGKKLVWRRPKPNEESVTEYFSLFTGRYELFPGRYPLYWFLSSEKRHRDQAARQEHLRQAEKALAQLAPKLNTPRLSRQAPIQKAVQAILDKYQVEPFINVRLATRYNRVRLRPRGRPPGEKARYRIRQKAHYHLEWQQNPQALKAERRVDGLFPLLCTNPALEPVEVLKAWKYQPRLEKRFEQLKHVHGVAPLLFKKVQRVEANLFIFFVALMAQALLERQLRQALSQQKREPLKLYPEDRDAPHPTTSQVLKTFAGLSTYRIEDPQGDFQEFRDVLKPVHRSVLELLALSELRFWTGT